MYHFYAWCVELQINWELLILTLTRLGFDVFEKVITTSADPDYHPDSMTDLESDSDPCSDVVLSPDLAKDEGAKVRPKPSSGNSLLSEEGKSNVERDSAWQAMGFAVADKTSACLECWGCLRNKKCYEVAKWERKQTAILKDKSASSLFLARAKASAYITSKLAEESLSQESLPSVSSLSSPVEEKEAASQESSSPGKLISCKGSR